MTLASALDYDLRFLTQDDWIDTHTTANEPRAGYPEPWTTDEASFSGANSRKGAPKQPADQIFDPANL